MVEVVIFYSKITKFEARDLKRYLNGLSCQELRRLEILKSRYCYPWALHFSRPPNVALLHEEKAGEYRFKLRNSRRIFWILYAIMRL